MITDGVPMLADISMTSTHGRERWPSAAPGHRRRIDLFTILRIIVGMWWTPISFVPQSQYAMQSGKSQRFMMYLKTSEHSVLLIMDR